MFAIAGGKGGCGKTTTALGLARALAATGRDPLVLDADVDMQDLHVRTDVPPNPNADAIADGAHVECVRHRSPEWPGVSLVPAGRDETTIATLERLERWHGPVLVDCPAGASTDATVPLKGCAGTVLITTDTPQSLADARKTATMAERLDAPVRATLIRGPEADAVTPPVDCRRVERLEPITDGSVQTDQRFRLACRSISEVILQSAQSIVD